MSTLTKPPTATPAEVELILDGGPSEDIEYWSREFPSLAEKQQVRLPVSRPLPGEPASKQAELIRKAVARRMRVLIVAPAPTPEVTDALRAAQEHGVGLVLLDRDVPGLKAAPAPTVVTYEPFAASARALVAAVKDEVKARHPRDRGVALLFESATSDRHAGERTAALREALEAADISLAPALPFDGQPEHGAGVLAARLHAEPRITMVLTPDSEGLSCAYYIARDRLPDRALVVAGYTDFRAGGARVIVQSCAAAADLGRFGLVSSALDAAVKLSRGEAVPARLEVPSAVRLGDPAARAADRAGAPRRPGD